MISVAAAGHANVKALVFVAGFAPEVGESATILGNRFPTGTPGQALVPPVVLADGDKDLYIDQARYWRQFAADLPQADAVGMAVTQRPITQSAFDELTQALSWRDIPSWFIWGSFDQNIPASLHAYMARRATTREAVEIRGASHVVMISQAHEVAAMIERAAQAR